MERATCEGIEEEREAIGKLYELYSAHLIGLRLPAN